MSGVSPSAELYLLWSHKNTSWWRPGGAGYTRRLSEAGLFPLAEAVERAARAIPANSAGIARGTAQDMGALPVLPVPAAAAAAMLAHYRAHHPDVPAEDWE